MKVVIVNHSDTRGGASVVSVRLLDALRREGIDVSMLVANREGDNQCIHLLQPRWRRKAAFLAEHLRIFVQNGFSRADLFKTSIATDGMPLHRHKLIAEADAVILNWVNQGVLSLGEVRKIAAMGKKVFWVMHDMWNMTGVCHHAGKCRRFCNECGCCPLVHRTSSPNDISYRTWLRKKALYSETDITFVAVSRWLAQRASESSLLASQRVVVIPNAFPVDDFAPENNNSLPSRAELGLPEGPLVLMGAARLDDPIKGLPIAIEALNRLQDAIQAGDAPAATAIFFGALRDETVFSELRLPFVHLGTVADCRRLRALYAHASVVLSASHYETLPGTLIEGQASGCYPVSFGQGGQEDIITHPQTGYIAHYPDATDLCKGIIYGLSGAYDTAALRCSVATRFSASAVARKWLALLKNEKK